MTILHKGPLILNYATALAAVFVAQKIKLMSSRYYDTSVRQSPFTIFISEA